MGVADQSTKGQARRGVTDPRSRPSFLRLKSPTAAILANDDVLTNSDMS